ncbi:hypothetical protein N7510_003474 [Penicillium lagena]|uniref:uncharacterized protein n=1 Tax=Penicillium lagena TaxID=94218 RepID=UPI0025403E5A|nr:uncharacterized protein N7510_003474 [Penicillium lagena]KAJ5619490.1 hypothetical protein N7510_003474 [Penicillium lagena]
MSGLPYLNKLRKPELVEFAEKTDLRDYVEYNKNELAVALDKHLRDNKSIFSGEKTLADYYKRLAAPLRGGSPVKRESAESPVTEKKKPGRKPTKQKEEEATESETPAKTLVKTPARASARAVRSVMNAESALPPSPAVVSQAIDRQTAKVREGIEQVWTSSGVLERSDALRASLSSLKAIEAIVLALEGGSVLKELIPCRYLTTTPAVSAAHLPSLPIKVPDLFVLVSGAFWAPFILWSLTSVILPLVAAFFFNLSGGASTRRTRSASSRASFDPLTFNIAKALLVYIVYAGHFTFWDVFSHYTVQKVNVSIPGEWSGMLTGTAIGVIGTLYEAILRH